MRMRFWLALSMTVLGGGAAAQELGDPAAGLDLAVAQCSDCHAVAADDGQSPDADAPPFPAVAGMTSTTRTSLLVWLQSSHPTMPNIKLDEDQTDNVIAYILSLKSE